MLLDADSFELAPRAPEVLARLEGDPRFKLELPASQLEIVTASPSRVAADAAQALLAARRALAERCGRRLVALRRRRASILSARASASSTTLPATSRISASTATIARRQLVCALQVHVSVGGRRARAGGLQRRAVISAAAGRAGGQCPLLRGSRHAAWLRCGRSSPSCSRARASRPRSRAGRSYAEMFRRGAAAVHFLTRASGGGSCGSTPASARSSSACPDAQSTVGRRRRDRRGDPVPRGLARRAARRGRAAAGRADVADRGEPLVGLPRWRRGADGRPRQRCARGRRAAS